MEKYKNALETTGVKSENTKVIKYRIHKGYFPDDVNVIAEVWESSNYDMVKACEAFGITKWTWYKWCEKPEVKAVLEQQREILMNKVERNLNEMLDSSDKSERWKATELVVKMRGKNRGYSEKTEVVHSGEISHRLMPIINYTVLPSIKDEDDILEATVIELTDKNNDDVIE